MPLDQRVNTVDAFHNGWVCHEKRTRAELFQNMAPASRRKVAIMEILLSSGAIGLLQKDVLGIPGKGDSSESVVLCPDRRGNSSVPRKR